MLDRASERMDALERREREAANTIRSAVREGIQDALRDDELARRFWAAGYQHLSGHATNGISQWIGKRVLMALIAAALSASIAWAVVTGKIK